ncbi:MAG TPA: hypothetical protein VHJ58_07415, partial [Vicinamibacterales bacterium]|nr:hypothetical protein [Vicinamibacterales bacterium]
MIHHERVKPPSRDYPGDEWSLIEKRFRPEFLAQTEALVALGNGYLGMRGNPEEGGPSIQNGTFINGFYESWPITYGEEAYGFARTGQTMVNVTDGKVVKLFVDDEPFWLPNAHLLQYERRLNMKSGTLDRDILWETRSGTRVRIRSRRLVSLRQRHVAAMSYEVTIVNAAASVVISSEMHVGQSGSQERGDDPRLAKRFPGKILQPRAHVVRDQRIVLVHETERTRLTLACGMDHHVDGDVPYRSSTEHTEDSGRVVFAMDAPRGSTVRLTKLLTYHTSGVATADELRHRAEWTLDRVVGQGFSQLLTEQ